jgi:hypothetical protein
MPIPFSAVGQAALRDAPTAIFIRQVLGTVAQLDKAMTVAKLRGARERKKRLTGRCEGRKNISELRPDVVALARCVAGGRRRRFASSRPSRRRAAICPDRASRSSRRSWRGYCAAEREGRARSRRRDRHRCERRRPRPQAAEDAWAMRRDYASR